MKPETIQLFKNIATGFVVLGLLAVLIWGLWHIVRLPALHINEVIVQGGETVSHQDIHSAVVKIMTGEYFRFVPKKFVLTYPNAEIYNYLKNLPRVKDPTVVRRGQEILITFNEYTPVALWCSDVGVGATTDDCVFLDDTGYGFAVAPELTGGLFTRFISVGNQATTGKSMIDQTDFSTLLDLEKNFSDFSWSASEIEIDQARDVFLSLSGDSHIKATLTMSPQETIDNLKTVLTAPKYIDLKPGDFKYIDLRFGNKVFVNEFGTDIDTASTTVEVHNEIE